MSDLDKREISLKRADELKKEIVDFIDFKKLYMHDKSTRDVITNKHKKELMEYFNASDDDWNDWHWQLKNRISSVSILSKFILLTESKVKIFEDVSKKYRWAVTPYYLSLMDFSDMSYPINLLGLPTEHELNDIGELDPMGEEFTNPAPCITRRYPNRLIMYVTSSCAAFCRHCQRRRKIGECDKIESDDKISAAIEYVRQNEEIRDVLITGGDPLMLPDDILESIIKRVREIEHVEIIRIGTRLPATMPQRITDGLVNMLKKYHPLFINIQFDHPDELTKDAVHACEKLADAGIPLGNQMVFLKGINNDKYIVQLLNEGLLKARVKPYYIFHPKQVLGTKHFEITVSEGLKIMEYLRGRTSGLAIPQYIVNAPEGLGKIPLLPDYIIENDECHIKLHTWEGKDVCITY